jgi:hypothetical protein
LNQVLEENDHGRAIFGAERITARYQSQLEGKGDLAGYRELFAERPVPPDGRLKRCRDTV